MRITMLSGILSQY